MLDAIRLPRKDAPIAASYVIDTPNCGRLQWLVEGEGHAAGTTIFLSARDGQADLSACRISGDLSRVWTALDYSG
ncbi:hypothetical protein D3C86_2147370 [compost metagenome]